MRLLSQSISPRLTITRTSRKAITDERKGTITLYETVTKIEVSLPSIFSGIKKTCQKFADMLSSAFLPKVYAY